MDDEIMILAPESVSKKGVPLLRATVNQQWVEAIREYGKRMSAIEIKKKDQNHEVKRPKLIQSSRIMGWTRAIQEAGNGHGGNGLFLAIPPPPLPKTAAK